MATLQQAMTIVHQSMISQAQFAHDRDAKRVVVMLQADPGTGKTSCLQQGAEETGARSSILSIAQYDPGEFPGWTVSQGDGMVRLRPDWMPVNTPEEQARAEAGEVVGWLIVDEPQNAPTMMMNILAQLVNERRVGRHYLPDGWAIVLAGNKDSNRAGTNKMPTHLRDRLTIIELEAEVETFLAYANKVGMSHLITGFVRARPDALNGFKRDAVAWSSARGLDRTNTILSWGLDAVTQQIAIAAQIGEGMAAELAGFIRIHDSMGDPAEALANPTTYPVPDADPSATYAMCAALSNMATADNFAAMLTYLKRFDHQEFAAFTVKDACNRKPELKKVPALRDYLLSHGKDLLLNW